MNTATYTKAGIKAAVHMMKELFEADKAEDYLLVDGTNVLNT